MLSLLFSFRDVEIFWLPQDCLRSTYIQLSAFDLTPVSCGEFYFLHTTYVVLCWILVHVDVGLHRKFYSSLRSGNPFCFNKDPLPL